MVISRFAVYFITFVSRKAAKTHKIEIKKRGYLIQRQKAVPIKYDKLLFEEGFRADIMVEDTVIVELKSVESIKPVHKKQLLTYLRLTDKKLGLLINFGSALIKDGIFRIVNGLPE